MVRSIPGTTFAKHIRFTLGELQLSSSMGCIRDINLLLGFVGILVPRTCTDFATIRDRASGIRKKIYGALSLGWDGAARTWLDTNPYH